MKRLTGWIKKIPSNDKYTFQKVNIPEYTNWGLIIYLSSFDINKKKPHPATESVHCRCSRCGRVRIGGNAGRSTENFLNYKFSFVKNWMKIVFLRNIGEKAKFFYEKSRNNKYNFRTLAALAKSDAAAISRCRIV